MNKSLSWKAPEYYYREKSADWYWALGIISISAAATAIIFDNVIFGIFILIGSFTLALYAARKPRIIQFEINDIGVVREALVYPYSTLESFWIEEHENILPKLLVKSKKTFMPLIVVPLIDTDIAAIEEKLDSHLKKEKFTEPFLHLIMEYLGF